MLSRADWIDQQQRAGRWHRLRGFPVPRVFLGAWMWDIPLEAALTNRLRTQMPVATGVSHEHQPWSKGSSGL